MTGSVDAPEAALAEGEALLTAGAVSHNHLWFRRRAIDATLQARDWGSVERHAAALEEYTRSEPLPWAEFFVARGCALAARWGSPRGTTPSRELASLQDEARGMGLRCALPALEAALSA